VERITAELWPGVPVVPVMSTGATDGSRLRNAGIPVYGVSGLFEDIDDVRGLLSKLGTDPFKRKTRDRSFMRNPGLSLWSTELFRKSCEPYAG
jgi:hypothetical protein